MYKGARLDLGNPDCSQCLDRRFSLSSCPFAPRQCGLCSARRFSSISTGVGYPFRLVTLVPKNTRRWPETSLRHSSHNGLDKKFLCRLQEDMRTNEPEQFSKKDSRIESSLTRPRSKIHFAHRNRFARGLNLSILQPYDPITYMGD